MTKYKNEWDVHVRNTGTIETTVVVRVRGNEPDAGNLYLTFWADKEGAKPNDSGYIEQEQTAMFPHPSVSKVVRVVDDEPEGDNLLAKDSHPGSGCGCQK
jgi:hypothetical protein